MKGRRITSIMLAAVIAAAGAFATEVPAAYAKSTPVIENKSNILKEDLRAKSHEALVIFKDTNALSGSEVRSRLSKSIKDIEVRKSWNIRKSGRKTVTVARVRSAGRSASQLVKLLKQRSDVRTASLNHQRRIRGGITSDTYADWQWNLASIDASYQWKNGGSTEDEQVIAVVDTGVDYTHEDLESAMWENTLSSLKGYVGYNFIDSSNNPMDGNGHGTHVAGTIAAESNNNKGISGVAPSVKIMALKAIDDEGFGYDSSFIDAYNYISKAQDLGVNIVAVNNSWGGIEENPVLTELINIVGQKGAVSVCAAGNEGEDNDEYDSFPANADSDYIISVGAVGADNKLASYSNYGSSVDAAAPGSNILSTVPYASYNPTIYSDSLRNELTQNGMYADFDGGGLDLAGCIEASDNPKGRPVRTEYVTSNVSSRSGRALKLTADLKAGEVATFEVPFTLEELGESKDTYTKQLSMMVSGQSSKGLGMFLVTSSPKDESIQTIEQMLSYWYSGVFISGSGSDYSDHLTVDLLEMMDEDEEDEEDLSSARSLYSSERELIRINASNGKTASLGMLPKSLSGKADFAMTSYNGEILFIGGYDKPAKGFTDEVIAYNPAAKKYRILASLPEGRAGGLAVQSGNRLVYAYGVSADDAAASDEVIVPELLVYDGKSWKKSEAELQLIKEYETDYVEEKLYGKKRYNVIKASIGIAKNGIVLIGAPFKVYGDTVLYNISKNEFRDSGYTYSSAGELFSGSCQGCSAGDRIFARSSYDDGFRTAEIDPSDNGMVMVSYNRNTSMAKKGTVSGVNRYRAPGNDVKITVKAGKKYAIRKIKVGSWTKTYSRPRKNVTVALKRITSDRAVNVTYIKK